MSAHTDDHPNIRRHTPTTQRRPMPKERVNLLHGGANRHHQKIQPGILQEISHQREIHSGSQNACHGRPTRKQRKREINPDTYELPPAFLDLIFPQHPLLNGHHSLPPRCCDETKRTINTKTQKKHRKRKSEAQQIRHRTGQTTQTNPKPTRTSIQPPTWQHNVKHTNNNTTLTAPALGLSQPTYQHKCERQKGAVKRGQNKNRPKTQNTVLDNTPAKTKNRHKIKQTKESANLPQKDTKRDTSLRDPFRQLETLVQSHTETQLKLHQNGIKIYEPFTRCPPITKFIHWNVKNVIISD
jgi:hypothetical protein